MEYIIKEVIKYIVSHNIPDLGKVKLAKLLFFIDREVWLATGKKFFLKTDFLRHDYGPLAANYYDTIHELKDNKSIKIEDIVNFDSTLHKITLEEPYNPAKLNEITSKQEQAIINYVIYKYGNIPAKVLVELTHDKVWQELSNGAVMPYENYTELTQNKHKIKLTREQRKYFDQSILEYEEQKRNGTLELVELDLDEIYPHIHSKS